MNSEQNYVEIKPKRCTKCGEDYTPIIHSDECPHNKVGVSEQKRLDSPERIDMKLEDRIERLEKFYEEVYHNYELLSIYIPRLTEANIKYLEGCTEFYFQMQRDVSKLRDILGGMLDDLQIHYKAHSDEVKRKKEYASKRETFTIK